LTYEIDFADSTGKGYFVRHFPSLLGTPQAFLDGPNIDLSNTGTSDPINLQGLTYIDFFITPLDNGSFKIQPYLTTSDPSFRVTGLHFDAFNPKTKKEDPITVIKYPTFFTMNRLNPTEVQFIPNDPFNPKNLDGFFVLSTAVPEPSAYGKGVPLLVLGGIAAMIRRQRSRGERDPA